MLHWGINFEHGVSLVCVTWKHRLLSYITEMPRKQSPPTDRKGGVN